MRVGLSSQGRAKRLLGREVQVWPEPLSPALFCHGQRQWVWGPHGYGAILLVNCDRDDLNCDDQDNCDQHVRCLQGEGDRSRPCPWWSRVIALSYPAGTPVRRPGSEGGAQGGSSSSQKNRMFPGTATGWQRPLPTSPVPGGGTLEELAHLSLWSREC